MSTKEDWFEHNAHRIYIVVSLFTVLLTLPFSAFMILILSAILLTILNTVNWHFLKSDKTPMGGNTGGARFLHSMCNRSLLVICAVWVVLGLAYKFGPSQAESLIEHAMDIPAISTSKELVSLCTTKPDISTPKELVSLCTTKTDILGDKTNAFVGRLYQQQVQLLRFSILVSHILGRTLDISVQVAGVALFLIIIMFTIMGFIHFNMTK